MDRKLWFYTHIHSRMGRVEHILMKFFFFWSWFFFLLQLFIHLMVVTMCVLCAHSFIYPFFFSGCFLLLIIQFFSPWNVNVCVYLCLFVLYHDVHNNIMKIKIIIFGGHFMRYIYRMCNVLWKLVCVCMFVWVYRLMYLNEG